MFFVKIFCKDNIFFYYAKINFKHSNITLSLFFEDGWITKINFKLQNRI